MSRRFELARVVLYKGTKHNPTVSDWMFRARSSSPGRHLKKRKQAWRVLRQQEDPLASCFDSSGKRILEVGPPASMVELGGQPPKLLFSCLSKTAGSIDNREKASPRDAAMQRGSQRELRTPFSCDTVRRSLRAGPLRISWKPTSFSRPSWRATCSRSRAACPPPSLRSARYAALPPLRHRTPVRTSP